MAEIILKAPWVAPGCHYLHATEPNETTHIPDAWVKEVPPGTIVIEETSPTPTAQPRTPGTLLREQDWLRKASTEEITEVLRLREPEGKTLTLPSRRNNVIPGTKV